jgi:hypothetical protein
MFYYRRILIALLTFILGLSTVWASGAVVAGIGIFGVSFPGSNVIEVAAPAESPQSDDREKFRRHHHPDCRKLSRSGTK